MKKSMTVLASISAGLSLNFLLSSCGKEKEPFMYDGEGQYSQYSAEVTFPGKTILYGKTGTSKLSDEERKKRCVIDTDAESDEGALAEVTDFLNATWLVDVFQERQMDRPEQKMPTYASFSLWPSQRKALLKSGSLGFERVFSDDEEIHYKKICISKPLQDPGRYQGFRIIELVAENNEGIAVFAVKAHEVRGRPHPVLLMTHRKYYRYGQTISLQAETAVFLNDRSGESSVRLSVFPARQAN
ncbi:MAG: hypothetical protein JNL01_01585 [Bdellovibrionales bacterium]|nr:hypothetical protein [Bdellovibrionales bacterium]